MLHSISSRTVVSLFLAALLGLAACGKSEDDAAQSAQQEEEAVETTQQEPVEEMIMDNGLEITVLEEGAGTEIQNGQLAVMHYTGWFYDEAAPDHKGDKFDSSRDRGRPLPFTLGAGQVIRGWDLGVLGMKPGERRILVIPSELAYGQAGHPAGIPPNSKLMFDVELVEIQ